MTVPLTSQVDYPGSIRQRLNPDLAKLDLEWSPTMNLQGNNPISSNLRIGFLVVDGGDTIQL